MVENEPPSPCDPSHLMLNELVCCSARKYTSFELCVLHYLLLPGHIRCDSYCVSNTRAPSPLTEGTIQRSGWVVRGPCKSGRTREKIHTAVHAHSALGMGYCRFTTFSRHRVLRLEVENGKASRTLQLEVTIFLFADEALIARHTAVCVQSSNRDVTDFLQHTWWFSGETCRALTPKPTLKTKHLCLARAGNYSQHLHGAVVDLHKANKKARGNIGKRPRIRGAYEPVDGFTITLEYI